MQSDDTSDLQAAIAFVTKQVTEQASRCGEPLTEEERTLLEYLPTSWTTQGYFPNSLRLVPRNDDYERLCRLMKEALQFDLETRPESLVGWRLAAAVLEFNKHPMLVLLRRAGIEKKSAITLSGQKSWRDQMLLLLSGLSLAAITFALIFYSVEIGLAVLFAIVVALIFVQERFNRRELARTIEALKSGPSNTHCAI